MIVTQNFTLNTQGNKTRVPAPLVGTVATGQWVTNQRIDLAAMPNGYMRYNYLLPHNYAQNSANYIYPLHFYGHENDEGGLPYPADGNSLVNFEANGAYNTVAFRTNYPCITVLPQCDQTLDGSGANGNANFGGYNDTPNSGGNEKAINALYQYFVNNFSVDVTRCYLTGSSLGAIGNLAWLVDNNRLNGINKFWTAAYTLSDQLYRPSASQPSNTTFENMRNVVYITVSTPSDNNPQVYDQAGWQYYTGNSNYPTPTTYANSGITACKAGNSQFYYVNYQGSNPWDTYRKLNADGGQGTSAYNLLFQQIV